MIRHEEMPRVEGSSLRYPDQGHLSPTYLGGERQVGWQRARRSRRRVPSFGRRESPCAPPRQEPKQPGGRKQNGATMSADEYAAHRGRHRRARCDRGCVPAGAPCAGREPRVTTRSRGSRAAEAWHFPCLEDGRLARLPPARRRLGDRAGRARCASAVREFLRLPRDRVLVARALPRASPSTSTTTMRSLAEHQRDYTIYDLREQIVPRADRAATARARRPIALRPEQPARR